MSPDTSSGRRRARRQSPNAAVVAIVLVAAVVILVVMLGSQRQREEPPPPAQSPTPTLAGPSPSPTSIVASSPEIGIDADLEEQGEETETAIPPPAPHDAACVRFSWRAGFKAGVEEPVPVEITVSNACRFEVDSSNIVFEVEGIQADEPVDVVTGACTGMLAPGESTLFTITLPARSEGYDRLEVAIVNEP